MSGLVSAQVSEFPWAALPVLRAADVQLEQAARTLLARHVDLGQAAALASNLFGAELQGYGVVQSSVTQGALPSLGADVRLCSAALQVQLSVEPGLLELLLTRVLGIPTVLRRTEPLTPSLQGALQAIVADVLRRLTPAEPLEALSLQLGAPPAPGAGGAQLCVDFWVRLDGASYSARVAVQPRLPLPLTPSLALNAPARIALPLVLLQTELLREQLYSLGVGDALVFDTASLPARLTSGVAWLCPAAGERALQVELTPSGLVLRGTCELSYEGKSMANAAESTPTTVTDVVLDANVVVRVEVAQVTLPARQWLGLKPGDVLDTDSALGEQVVLRVNGGEVARGELVNVDGKLGVRLTRLTQT